MIMKSAKESESSVRYIDRSYKQDRGQKEIEPYMG